MGNSSSKKKRSFAALGLVVCFAIVIFLAFGIFIWIKYGDWHNFYANTAPLPSPYSKNISVARNAATTKINNNFSSLASALDVSYVAKSSIDACGRETYDSLYGGGGPFFKCGYIQTEYFGMNSPSIGSLFNSLAAAFNSSHLQGGSQLQQTGAYWAPRLASAGPGYIENGGIDINSSTTAAAYSAIKGTPVSSLTSKSQDPETDGTVNPADGVDRSSYFNNKTINLSPVISSVFSNHNYFVAISFESQYYQQ